MMLPFFFGLKSRYNSSTMSIVTLEGIVSS